MRSVLTALAVGLLATARLMPAGTPALAGTPTPADGAVLKSCTWSSAGDCPFHAVKGTDYIFRVNAAEDCDGTVELVNPAGQVTITLVVADWTDGCDGSDGGVEFRAAYTGTFRLRYVPSGETPPGPGAASADIVSDCRADAKTRCVLPLGGRQVAGETSTPEDTDWFRVDNLRRGRLYTFNVVADYAYASLAALDAKGTVLAKGHTLPGGTGTVRFRPKANGTYFFSIYHAQGYTIGVK